MEPTFRYLLDRYVSGKISSEEMQHFAQLLSSDHYNQVRPADEIFQWLTEQPESVSDYDRKEWDKILKRVLDADKEQAPVVEIPKRSRLLFLRYAAAVVFITALSVGTYFFVNRNTDLPANTAHQEQWEGIEPGNDKAKLTLADGTVIELDSAGEGVLATEGGASVQKTKSGEVLYDMTTADNSAALVNTIQTPRGGQYRLVLSDGSKVWLNAASSVVFPTTFTKNERRIKVTGEVYIEVAHNPQKPFIVDTDKQMSVKALGTGFNINAYPDEEEITTTLVEGRVEVSEAGLQGLILLPGGQAIKHREKDTPLRQLILSHNQVEQVLAWKNGYFNFENTSILEMSRQIERWYDVTFEFRGNFSDMVLSGKMDRGVKVQDIIQFFNDYGLKTEVDGRRITVTR